MPATAFLVEYAMTQNYPKPRQNATTRNKLSPQRCMVSLTAMGPSYPETAPLDPSNASTELTIDITDKNDF